jgi:phage terminase large subunit-like protein
MQFFRLGAQHQERCFMAANRVGKTWGAGGYETTLHLTGEYPDWWEGRRFDRPVDWWAAGETSETTRDVVQKALLGPLGQLGQGLIPGRLIIGGPTKRMGVAGAVDMVHIEHVSGGTSHLGFKSFDQGRSKFQGTEKHGIWLDEEPPMDVYGECLTRLMTTSGLMLLTFTPLLGLSEVALRFLPEMAPDVAA